MFKRHILSFILMACATAPAGASEAMTEINAQQSRGEKLFGTYCSRCHGKKADGEGRMVKRLYRKKGTQLPTDFTVPLYADRTDEYLRTIITEGGEAHSMSQYMPPFGQELSEKGVNDLVYFVKNVSANDPDTDK